MSLTGKINRSIEHTSQVTNTRSERIETKQASALLSCLRQGLSKSPRPNRDWLNFPNFKMKKKKKNSC